ncbi:hypothetical protein VDGE_30781 [Verticillium dahliae]|uniref:Uncharacterized protein n=1 Tax=Verticillium dahliae TaxID=27337 RepID=A0A444RY14_VERDA|nr:hypothetical protein VDGE_30781 [Verticillium dahliae]
MKTIDINVLLSERPSSRATCDRRRIRPSFSSLGRNALITLAIHLITSASPLSPHSAGSDASSKQDERDVLN